MKHDENPNPIMKQSQIMSVSKKLGQNALVYTTAFCPNLFETDVSKNFIASKMKNNIKKHSLRH